MSPLSLRRYRAERLLREEFDRLRAAVLANARARLRASGVHLDRCDLDACYAQAWQGLYAAVLDGQRIANPGGWLSLATVRRAIDEYRARERAHCHAVGAGAGAGGRDEGVAALPAPRVDREHDFAAELDDRAQLRHLFEGLRCRLSSRELQAAALCYLQGFSRAEAAAHMGLSERRMRRLMEGSGERLGVAGKVGALAETIRSGAWCEEQGSLMRAFAYGVLDPGGERYRLALIHRSECPACRAYVISLRGLAAALPPVPALLRWALPACASGGAGAGVGAHVSAGMSGTSAAGASAGAGLAPQGPGLAGALSASGAGAGAAGGSWLLAGGSLSAKLAVGCLLALGLGAGCVALTERPQPSTQAHRRAPRRDGRARSWSARLPKSVPVAAGGQLGARARGGGGADRVARAAARPLTRTGSQGKAAREFGPEQLAAVSRPPAPAPEAGRAPAIARSASAPGAPMSGGQAPAGGSSSAARPRASAQPAAEREFAPG